MRPCALDDKSSLSIGRDKPYCPRSWLVMTRISRQSMETLNCGSCPPNVTHNRKGGSKRWICVQWLWIGHGVLTPSSNNCTVPTSNSCTKKVKNPGIIHGRKPDRHPIPGHGCIRYNDSQGSNIGH